MKKKITAILLAIALLAGCEAAPATAQEITPDINAIVQQSVAEAIAQYEESQREKDSEIAGLKAQLEELTSQDEETPDIADPPETAPQKKPLPRLPVNQRNQNPSRSQSRRNPPLANPLHHPHAMTDST